LTLGKSVAATFLFTDLVGSTELSSRLSATEEDALRQGHFGALRAAVESTAGREVKNLGDGLMVVFSSPSRALMCAVEMQQAIDRNNRRSDTPLSIRIGLSTGEATEDDGDFFGDPVVEAARLCAKAQGGQILATELLRLTVGRHAAHEYVRLGDMELKGLPDPVSVVEVRWEPSGDAAGEDGDRGVPLPSRLALASSGGVFGFAGRGSELATLEEARKQTLSEKRLKVVLLGGEPGVGKSSLAAQVARRLREEGETVLFGECVEGTNAPYLPWMSALAHLVRHTDTDVWSSLTPVHSWALRRLLPAESSRLPTGETVDTDPETEQFLLMESVVQALEIACSISPVMIVLDDLHWADSATLTLLRHLVGCSAEISCLVVGTYRHSDLSRDHPLTSLLADLHREPSVRRVDVGGLGDDEIIELIENAAGYELDEEGVALAHALRRETDGNPFFVAELLRHLVESGAIAIDQAGRFEMAGELDELGLPQSVRDVVARRVARLGDEPHKVLSTASVLGREFELDILSRVADVDVDRLLDLMDEASAAALVSESESSLAGRYRFTHALVQHALYGELSTARRQRIHLRAAEVLEPLPSTSGSEAARVADLARHWQAATRPADAVKAIEYSRLAGEAAMDAFSPADAARWYAQALELAEREATTDLRQRFELMLALARAQLATDQVVGHSTLKAAGELAERIGDLELLSRWANSRLLGWRASESADPEFLRMLEGALSKVNPQQKALRARLLASIADETDPEEWSARHELALAALSAAADAGDEAVRLEVFLSTSFLVPPEEAERQRDRVADAYGIAIAGHDPINLAGVLGQHVTSSLIFGDVEAARRSVEALEEMEAKYRLALTQHLSAMTRVGLSMMEGDLGRLEDAAQKILELGMRGFPSSLATYGGCLFELRWAQGRLAEFMEMFSNATTELRSYAGFRPALVLSCLEAGRTDEARAVFEQDAATGFETFPRDAVWLSCMTLFADAAVTFDDRDAARALHGLISPFGHLYCATGPIFYGLADRAAGRLAGFLGDLDEAEARLRHALGEHRRIGARYWQATSAVDLAEVLEQVGGIAQSAEAQALKSEAHELAEGGGFGAVAVRLGRPLAL
jgi:class 3 adenylate cyclase/DNA polymerase III delta prime subunit